MKKGLKRLLITLAVLIAVAVVIFLSVFLLAKQKKVFINKWFVNEKNSTIGVDVSAYQADIDMNALKEQNVAFIFIKATEGSSKKDDRFAETGKTPKKLACFPARIISSRMTPKAEHRLRISSKPSARI